MPASLFYGPLVKRLRQRPLTPLTWVRFPHGSPLPFQEAGETSEPGHSPAEGGDLGRRSKGAKGSFPREREAERSGLCDDDAPLAQLVEQLTLNQWVPGSSP